MASEYKQFIRLFVKATARVGEEYFQLPVVEQEDPIYRERVYCYELYHQLRSRWRLKSLSLCGEVDKAGHPLIRGIHLDRAKPDFIIHQPDSMACNLVVIEVKPITVKRADVLLDLQKLTSFVEQANYQCAIYLIYGDDPDRFRTIQSVATEFDNQNDVQLNCIGLWWHRRANESAIYQRWGETSEEKLEAKVEPN